jgi:hypothetical protein
MAWSASKNYVFQSFKYALGAGLIKNVNYNNLRVNITDSNFLETNYYRIKGIHNKNEIEDYEKAFDYNNLKVRDLEQKYVYLASGIKGQKGANGNISYTYRKDISSRIMPLNKTLGNTLIDSINKDTMLTDKDCTFERADNMPCSSRIFSKDNDGSWVTHDLDWSLNVRNKPGLMKYFAEEYNFKTEYDSIEYATYGVKPNVLNENVIRLSAESFVQDDPNDKIKEDDIEYGVMAYGAGGILLTYANEDEGLTGKNELPVAYYDFGNTLHSNYNYIKLDWHEDGVIKVE